MRGLGQLLLVFGLVSAALKLWLPGVHFLLLIWIDNWGNQTGWAIRIGMIVLGAVLLGLSYRGKKPVPGGTPQPPPPGRI
ncbi:MAG: hypothetical protein Q8L55_07825 [Phycisphaerales bacterium]|nr:hypothetical protein [Phycisphaerales bacterium]